MNRRGFFAFLAAAPAAAIAGLRLPKRPWYFGDGLRHRPTATGTTAFLTSRSGPVFFAGDPVSLDDYGNVVKWGHEKVWGRAEAAASIFKDAC